MENLHKLTMQDLIELLTKQTNAYFQLEDRGASLQEFEKCRALLRALQQEILVRKKNNGEKKFDTDEIFSD